VGVEREDEMLDVKALLEDVEDLEDKEKSGIQQSTIGAMF